jgi:uncharacterized protein (TIGR03435 family)
MIRMFLKTVAAALFSFSFVMAQTPPAPKDAAPAKQLAFDVISIRQNTSAPVQMGPPIFGPTADGYRLVNAPIVLAILSAYEPQAGNGALFTPDRIVGLPDWATRDRFDIDAKVAQEDMAEWQKPDRQKAMLEAMLQALLLERCKIAVHRDNKDTSVYSLVVGKNGPKFKQTNPADPVPDGVKLPGGAVLVQSRDGMEIHGATMGLLASVLSSMGGPVAMSGSRPVQDKTGLTGKYDIKMTRPDMGPPPGGPGGAGPGGGGQFDPTEMVVSMVDSLGLKLESTKASVETLVIDHIEIPSAN